MVNQFITKTLLRIQRSTLTYRLKVSTDVDELKVA